MEEALEQPQMVSQVLMAQVLTALLEFPVDYESSHRVMRSPHRSLLVTVQLQLPF